MLKVSRRGLGSLLTGLVGLPLSLRSEFAMAGENGFPAGFVWGASTSSYQIEGAVDVDGRGKSIWDVFCETPGKVRDGDTGATACDHYHRWREDVDLLARGKFDAYRFSTAWPRILPAGAGKIETRGLDFYDHLVDGLLEHGITPWLCLYHWDLPQALQEKGGWASRDVAANFADYARITAARLGDRVKHWAMFNEPNIQAMFGYGTGGHAPGVTGLPNALAATHHQNLAQGLAIKALRAEHPGLRLGTVLSVQPARPSSASDADRTAAVRFDAFWNSAFLDPLFKGAYPTAIAELFTPLIRSGDLQAIRQPVDFIGINYYAPMWVADAPQNMFGAWWGAVPAGLRFTSFGWPIDASGLTDTLTRLRDQYGNPEVYVTENGACYDDPLAADGTVHDEDRIAYLREHLAAARDAIAAGVKLRGYFVWSLLDNFEWAEGYHRRFGIVHVDFKTQKRTPKASFAYLADVIRGRA